MKKVQEIKILPIFAAVQPSVWKDVVRVKYETLHGSYDYSMPLSSVRESYSSLKEGLEKKFHSILFVAYHNNVAIGYIYGVASKGIMTINDLYVKKDFQKMKVGNKLLRAAESAGALVSKKIELKAIKDAGSFYARNGYTSCGSVQHNCFFKYIKKTKTLEVVPVFKNTPSINKVCLNISNGLGYDFVFPKNEVFFVCMSDSKIVGFGKKGGDNIFMSPDVNIFRNFLEKKLSRLVTACASKCR